MGYSWCLGSDLVTPYFHTLLSTIGNLWSDKKSSSVYKLSWDTCKAFTSLYCNELLCRSVWCPGSDLVTPHLHTLKVVKQDQGVAIRWALTGTLHFQGCLSDCSVLNMTCELSPWTDSQALLHHDTKYLHEWFDCAKMSTQLMSGCLWELVTSEE